MLQRNRNSVKSGLQQERARLAGLCLFRPAVVAPNRWPPIITQWGETIWPTALASFREFSHWFLQTVANLASKTTQDGLVDLSPYLVEGANGIELHSTRDMSKYVFALVLHPPTPGQLAWKSEQCKREKDWKDWIKILTQPFNLNPVPLLKR